VDLRVKSLIGLLGMKCGYWQYKLNGLTDRIVYEKPQTIKLYTTLSLKIMAWFLLAGK
jgi:hypothetical protein